VNPSVLLKLRVRHIISLPRLAYQFMRVTFYRLLSNAHVVSNGAKRNQPVLTAGKGEIILGKCNLGFWPSPYFFNGYTHIEARSPQSKIIIGDGVCINNNAVIIADRTCIRIEANTLIGPEFTVYDSDFHDLHPERRNAGTYECLPVTIGENVFIGSRVTVLKGVTIGKNSVVAAGSVLGICVPENTIVGGVPAKIIGHV
jgi:maltose O-acetyltransferase